MDEEHISKLKLIYAISQLYQSLIYFTGKPNKHTEMQQRIAESTKISLQVAGIGTLPGKHPLPSLSWESGSERG